jgi:hypothetical protein
VEDTAAAGEDTAGSVDSFEEEDTDSLYFSLFSLFNKR